MAQKIKINSYVYAVLAEEFRNLALLSSGNIGLSLSAAMLLFLESSPEEQSRYVRRILEAEQNDSVKSLVTGSKPTKARGTASDPRKR